MRGIRKTNRQWHPVKYIVQCDPLDCSVVAALGLSVGFRRSSIFIESEFSLVVSPSWKRVVTHTIGFKFRQRQETTKSPGSVNVRVAINRRNRENDHYVRKYESPEGTWGFSMKAISKSLYRIVQSVPSNWKTRSLGLQFVPSNWKTRSLGLQFVPLN